MAEKADEGGPEVRHYCKRCGTEISTPNDHAIGNCPYCCTDNWITIPDYETPEQYQERTGVPLRDGGMVWIWIPGGEEWESCDYWQAKQIENDLLRLDKDFDADHDPLAVLVFNGPYPPPDEWRAK